MPEQAQRRHVARPRGLLLHEGTHHRGDGNRDSGAVALDLVEALTGVERGEQHERTTEPENRHERSRARDVKEGRHREVHVVGLEPTREGLVEGIRDQVAVRQHHSLGPAGRPTGEVQKRELVLVTMGGHLGGLHAVEQRLPLLEGHDSCHRVAERTGIAVRHEQARAGGVSDRDELGRRQTRVQRQQDHPRRGHTDVGLHIVMAVAGKDRDPITALQPERCHRRTHSVAPIGELGVADRAIATDERRAGRGGASRPRQRRCDRRVHCTLCAMSSSRRSRYALPDGSTPASLRRR